MSVIAEFLSTIVNAIVTSVQMVVWLSQGLSIIAALMTRTIAVFGSVMRIFPVGVAAAVTGVCGGLIVLRIFGRS